MNNNELDIRFRHKFNHIEILSEIVDNIFGSTQNNIIHQKTTKLE